MRRLTERDKATVRRMHGLGYSDRGIAKVLGTSPQTVMNYRHKVGLPANSCSAKVRGHSERSRKKMATSHARRLKGTVSYPSKPAKYAQRKGTVKSAKTRNYLAIHIGADIGAEAVEFGMAMSRWKAHHPHEQPGPRVVLQVARSLGYRKVEA